MVSADRSGILHKLLPNNRILKNYKENVLGVGILVNTSFNIHNEPIVETPENAFNHLQNGIVDVLVSPYGIYTR